MPTKKTTKTETPEEEVLATAPEVVDEDDTQDDMESAPILEDVEINEDGEKKEKYYEAIGRRKAATARVRLLTKKSTDAQADESKALIFVNDQPYYEYFPLNRLQAVVESPFKKLKSVNRFKASIHIYGGGIAGQADAIKFGLSRALILFDPNFAKKLRRAGFLTRDARVKERRKYGLKKARKSPQWSKR